MPLRLTSPHKYRAQAITVDGIRFHSKAEARRYGELKLLEKAGEISGLQLQPRFPLCAAKDPSTTNYADDNSLRVVGEYVADFWYRDKSRHVVVEDVKGVRTSLYQWKKKHMFAQYGLTITEIRYGR